MIKMFAGMMRFGTEGAQTGLDDRYFRYHSMMGWLGNGTGIWFYGVLWLVTWILIVAVLAALVRWLWKKGDSETKRR
ncbi:hypothetical protein HYZ70_00220 [Candidatus Curtissbacteria bacterium]|nr:hypothetical protein [Candidatus Curtissbacteria bacterium]